MDNTNYNDAVISTRVRLARNISGYPFVHRLNAKAKQEVIEAARSALMDSSSATAADFRLIKLWELSPIEAAALAEKHLISREFASNTDGHALLLSNDETVSIMINEEDHLRIQVILPGFCPEQAYELADKIDTLLDERLGFSFDEKLGYLTQCPTNLGTGLRASVMLHLPAMHKLKAMPRIAGNLSKLGFTIRGIYGEGSDAQGAMYQLSNQVSLGISEKAAIDNLKNIAIQLINQERSERASLIKNTDILDSISRSLGLLKYARSISHSEAMQLISNVRLGIVGGAIDSPAREAVDSLLTSIQPASLMQCDGRELTAAERDERRARLIQERLG